MEDPFALALDYRMKFSSAQITKASIHEMARFSDREEGDFQALRTQLETCFPNVKKGDQIIGVSEGPDTARFYYNGEESCAVKWPEFRELFFGIWLGEDTRAPRKARVLKGLDK